MSSAGVVTSEAGSHRRLARIPGWGWLLAAGVLGLLSLVPAHDISGLLSFTGRVWPSAEVANGVRLRFSVDLISWWVLFIAGAACLLRAPRRAAVALALAVGLGLGVASLSVDATLSNDFYRYAWDGRVQAAGIDPYRYPPNAEELRPLRDDWLWPPAEVCAARGKDPGCTLINRYWQPTIYPPAAQAWFSAVDTALPAGVRTPVWQGVGLFLYAVVAGLLLWLLTRWRRDPRWVVLWAWCPYTVLEGVQATHVDTLVAVLALLVVAVAQARPVLASVLVSVAALVKLYPAVLLPVALRRQRLAVVLTFVAVFVAAYVPHVLAVGPRVVGYLPTYLNEEGYGTGNRFLLLDRLGVDGPLATALAAAVLAAVGLYVATRSRRTPDADARLLLGIMLLLVTPIQPWYALPLVALAALGGAWPWLVVAAAGHPFYLAVLSRWDARTIGTVAYGLAAVVVVVAALATRRRRRPVAIESG